MMFHQIGYHYPSWWMSIFFFSSLHHRLGIAVLSSLGLSQTIATNVVIFGSLLFTVYIIWSYQLTDVNRDDLEQKKFDLFLAELEEKDRLVTRREELKRQMNPFRILDDTHYPSQERVDLHRERVRSH